MCVHFETTAARMMMVMFQVPLRRVCRLSRRPLWRGGSNSQHAAHVHGVDTLYDEITHAVHRVASDNARVAGRLCWRQSWWWP